jgi:hypothetical protein
VEAPWRYSTPPLTRTREALRQLDMVASGSVVLAAISAVRRPGRYGVLIFLCAGLGSSRIMLASLLCSILRLPFNLMDDL